MSAETTDKPTLVNRALVMLGRPPSFTVDTETDLGRIVEAIWENTLDFAFSLHDWTMLRRTAKLPRHAATPDNGWTHGHTMPGDRLGGPRLLLTDPRCPDNPLRRYAIEGDSIYCDEKDVWGRFKVRRDPETWDGGFTNAFLHILASNMAVPVREDERLRDDYRTMAIGTPQERLTGGLFGRLISEDRANEPQFAPMSADSPLVQAHSGSSFLRRY